MDKRRVELEAEVADWLDQLPVASFATATFFISLLSLQGALLPKPYGCQLGGKLSRLHAVRFFAGLEPAGITYWHGPRQRLVLLTVFRERRVQRRHEVTRARDALLSCASHGDGDHGLWHEMRDSRMNRQSAAEVFLDTRLSYEFGRTVRTARERLRWTMRELAEAAETSETMVIRCEAGGIPPATPVALRLVDALGGGLPPAPAARPSVVT